jgi:hypothetical protein
MVVCNMMLIKGTDFSASYIEMTASHVVKRCYLFLSAFFREAHQ